MDIIERIKNRVKVNECGCWIWQGSKSGDGYGLIEMPQRHTRRVHRVMYEAAVGTLLPGMFVCHRCDVPLCVNPDHLFLGTPKDNSHDMVLKGRSSRGEKASTSVLSEADVPEIVQRYKNGESGKSIAASYGIQRNTVLKILRGETWAHVERESVTLKSPQSKGSGNPGAKLNESDVAEIRRLLATGVSQSKIGREFGVSQSAISFINRRKSWSHVA